MKPISRICLIVSLLSSVGLGAAARAAVDDLDHAGAATYIYLAEWSELRHRAELGNVNAQFQLANMYYAPPEHSTFPQSNNKALYWYVQAALRGLPAAQHNIGIMYFLGLAVPADSVEGIAWFLLAAQNGNSAGKKLSAEYEPQLSPEGRERAHKRFQELQAIISNAQNSNVFRPESIGLKLTSK